MLEFFRQYLQNRRRSFAPVFGKVVYIETRYGSKGRITYTPVYQYEYGGEVYQRVYDDRAQIASRYLAARGSSFVVGSLIPVLVDRDDPEYAVVNDYSRYMLLWRGLGLIIIGFFLFD